MTRPIRSAALAAALLVLAAGCGGTRFVVVQAPVEGAAPAASGAAATATTVAAGPTTAEDDRAVRKVVAEALSLDPKLTFADRTPYIEGGDDLEPTFLAVRKITDGLDVDVVVDEVAVAGDTATATVTVKVSGADYAAGVPVEVARKDGAWKVTRGGACALLAVGSPCPDA